MKRLTIRLLPRFPLQTLCLALLLCLLATQMADACPTCKDSLADGANSQNLVRGFGWSIIFMMSAPFLILAGLSSYFYYEVRKARAAQAQKVSTEPQYAG